MFKGARIDAITQASRRWAVRKYVSKMPAAVRADRLGTAHAMRVVLPRVDALFKH